MKNKGLKVQKLKGSKVGLLMILVVFLQPFNLSTFQPFNITDSLAEKPRGPLELSFSANPSPAVGAVIHITLTVTTRVDAPEMVISIELPNDLPHLSGQLHWAGSAVKDQPVSLVFQVGPLSDRSYEIVGRATVTLPPGPGQANGSTWTQATSLVLEAGRHPPASEQRRPSLRQDRQGPSILEIPVK